MESTVVIKVNYGEALRRFNARVVNERLDLGIDGLRKKIIGLFNFAPDAEFTLTYIDEDEDVVTLVDEEDLHDAMRQSLNPFRITVKLNAEKSGRHYARSSGSSTPMRSPRIQQEMLNLNANVSEILKSVPEPFREAISKFSTDLASKASSSSSVITELVECISKMGLSYMNRASELQGGIESAQQGGVSGGTLVPSITEDLASSRIDGSKPEVQQRAAAESPTLLGGQVLPQPESGEFSSKNKKAGLKNTNKCVDASAMPLSAVDALVTSSPISMNVNGGHTGDNSLFECPPAANSADLGGGIGRKSSHCSGNSSGSQFGINPLGECPFTGIPVANDLAVSSPQCVPRVGPFTRSCNKNEGIGTIFHRGVGCNGCGVHPITGPRFKSKLREDYDLCHICFDQLGNETDYIRMDRPATHRHSSAFKGFYDPMWQSRVHPPTLPPVLKGIKPNRPKLDSCFVLDVNVLDGTIMAPSTPFIKIWRMRNNGTMLWPQGVRLVWIGGDRLSNAKSVELEMPASGLPVDEELDIAVDFTAPEHPGRYVSYWRMALPSGQHFGQRIWVLIQVDASLRDMICGRFEGLNLNLPPPSNDVVGPEIVNVNIEPMVEDSFPEPYNSNRATQLVGPAVEATPNKEQELNFPSNDAWPLGDVGSSPSPEVTSASVSYPIVDFSEVSPAVPSSLPSAIDVQAAATQNVDGNNDVEQTLLRELEDMGFKQVDLNKEILRMNKYDLEQSVNDLCGAAEWDTILEELQEMGFCDEEMNKRLLKKNNGSIKRVVMDLIAGKKT